MIERDTGGRDGEWAVGITVKRTREGYTWTISVPAFATEEQDEIRSQLDNAVAEAARVDDALVRRFGGGR